MIEENDSFIEVVNVQLVSEKKLYCNNCMSSPEAAIEILGKEISKYNRECFAIINLQTDCKVINFNICSLGSINATISSPAEAFKCALLANAASIIIMHNHPSGNLIPSNADIQVTKRFEECCDFMNIGFLDHIIVGEEGKYYSFREHGLVSSKDFNAQAIGDDSQVSIKESEQVIYKRKIR